MPIPFHSLTPTEVDILRQESITAEALRTLTAKQLEIIIRKNWFNLFVPRSHNGLELALPEAVRIEEDLARVDGSLGWTTTLCSGAAMFIGYLEKEWASEAFNSPNVCFAGSGRANGTALLTNDGYWVNGAWGYASGAPHATIFTANCVIYQNDIPLLTSENNPVILSFCFKKEEVKINNDWHTMGLRATAGHSFEVTNQLIPLNRAFLIQPEARKIDTPIFKYPFIPFAEITTAVNTLGMGLHFLEECRTIFQNRRTENKLIHNEDSLLSEKTQEILKLRVDFHTLVEKSWQECLETQGLTTMTCEKISKYCKKLVRDVRASGQVLFPYCGMQAAREETNINRIWRDLQTASQHTLLL